MAKLTQEEKDARRRERFEREQLAVEKYQEAFYVDDDIQIIFEAGRARFFILRTNQLKKFRPARIGGEDGWMELQVMLTDIDSVASLTAALTCRLNDMIEDANADIAKCAVKKLSKPQDTTLKETTT